MGEAEQEEDRHNYIVAVAKRYLADKDVMPTSQEASDALEAICTGVWRQGILPDMEVAEERIVSNILGWAEKLDAEEQDGLLEAMRGARADTSSKEMSDGPSDSSGIRPPPSHALIVSSARAVPRKPPFWRRGVRGAKGARAGWAASSTSSWASGRCATFSVGMPSPGSEP